ncbi:MAG: TIGR02646 family protein [Saprospiraceae bacterium]|nr:TIGR02646 family protein [Saprospiraceae bacterium]
MKWINKNRENQPASLKRHLTTPHHNYDNYKEKDELRDALLKEQGFICCYCMQRIQEANKNKMEIEHFRPQSIYDGTNGKPDLTLDYTNLLASCKGNEGSLKHLQHCDEHKGNDEVEINPMNKDLMGKIRFNAAGRIFVSETNELDKRLNHDLNHTLNLNIQTLVTERKKIWQTLEQRMRKEFGTKNPSKSFINQKIKEWSAQDEGKFKTMCQVAIYYLEKKLKKAV